MAIVLTTDDTRREVFLKAEQAKIHTGSILPELDNPASIGDVIAGKEYIDGNGEKKSGTLVVCDTVYEVETLPYPGTGLTVELESTVDGSTKMLMLPEPNLKSENIISGVSIFGIGGNAKTMRVESGTITPAEDTVSLTLPEPYDGVKALVVSAADQAELETKGENSNYSYRAIIAHARNQTTDIVGALIRYNGKTYVFQATAMVSSKTGEIYIVGSTGRYFRAGIVYNYYAYYWEDDA